MNVHTKGASINNRPVMHNLNHKAKLIDVDDDIIHL